MNFSILTSKQKLFIAFAMVLLMLVSLNLLLVYMAEQQTSKNRYINDKFSKLKHFEYQEPFNKDIVFIGSSRTFYHISTNLFKEHGFDIYNFGVSGSKLPDYPTMIEKTIQYQPKQVVLSLRVDKLYEPLLVSEYPSYDELSYYASIDSSLFLQATLHYLLNFHTLLQYSEPIYHKIASFYNRFNFNSSLAQTDALSKDAMVLQDHDDYSKRVGCRVYDVKQTSDKHLTLKCRNGDGIIIGSDMRPEKEVLSYELTKLDEKTQRYLTKMIQRLHDHNINVTLVLEPILNNQYQYNFKQLSETFPNITIIDLSNYELSEEKWADNRHLNYLGREAYSRYLIQNYLKNLNAFSF